MLRVDKLVFQIELIYEYTSPVGVCCPTNYGYSNEPPGRPLRYIDVDDAELYNTQRFYSFSKFILKTIYNSSQLV